MVDSALTSLRPSDSRTARAASVVALVSALTVVHCERPLVVTPGSLLWQASGPVARARRMATVRAAAGADVIRLMRGSFEREERNVVPTPVGVRSGLT